MSQLAPSPNGLPAVVIDNGTGYVMIFITMLLDYIFLLCQLPIYLFFLFDGSQIIFITLNH